MKVIDTCELVRFLVQDDPRQAQAASHLIERTPIWLPKTVILETERVLHHACGFSPAVVAQALTKVCDLPKVTV